MVGYIIRRLAQIIVLAFLVSFLIFFVLRMMPGDPARLLAGMKVDQEQLELIREKYGLNEPWYQQYFIFLSQAFRGKLGTSLNYNTAVGKLLWERFLHTIPLVVCSLGMAVITGIIFGVIAAVKRHTFFDHFTMGFAALGVSMPQFWLGLMLIYFFVVRMQLFPSHGFDSLISLVLPSITIALTYIAINARVTRSSMLDVLSKDYIQTARSKGQKEWKVIVKHGLRNALIPIITVMGLQLAGMLMGLVVVETVFSWPGLGRLFIDSVHYRDYPVLQALMIYSTVGILFINFTVDVLYAVINPRIRYS